MNLDVSTREGYAIATALRGPDKDYTTLKWIITGWIRNKCGVPSDSGVRVRTERLTDKTILRAKAEVNRLFGDKSDRVVIRHWVLHAIGAINHLGRNRWLWNLTQTLMDMMICCTQTNKENVLWWLDHYPTKEQVEGGENK